MGPLAIDKGLGGRRESGWGDTTSVDDVREMGGDASLWTSAIVSGEQKVSLSEREFGFYILDGRFGGSKCDERERGLCGMCVYLLISNSVGLRVNLRFSLPMPPGRLRRCSLGI